jgi:CubicO group peptidase (beta-lactamase class C family)
MTPLPPLPLEPPKPPQPLQPHASLAPLAPPGPWGRRERRLAALLLLAGSVGVAGALVMASDGLQAWMVRQGKALVADFRHFDAMAIARAAAPRPLPAVPAALHWPAASGADVEGWLAGHGTVALLVLRDGRLVHERYFDGFTRATVGTSFSVAKSVVSALVGIALHEGRIGSLDEPLTRWLPELLERDARFGAVTLRHLLAMRSGIAFDEGYGRPWSDVSRFYMARDLGARVRALAIAGAPDRRFAYQSGDTQLLAMALERAVGEPLARYAERKLWQPMGAEFDASWSLDSEASGQAKAFCCLNARAVDLARFGQLFLDDGRVGERQVLPADWVRASTAVQDRPGAHDVARRNIEMPASERRAFYAWQWRRAARPDGEPDSDFWAQGLLGQFVYVSPASRMVIVRLGRHQGEVFWPGWMGELARLNR